MKRRRRMIPGHALPATAGLWCLAVLTLAPGLLPATGVSPAGETPPADAAGDHCAGARPPTPFTRSQAAYALPEVTLVDQAGRPFSVAGLSKEGRPVAVNFIFTTCTTICPVMSATFAQTRRELGDDAGRVHFVSISIDPENDTPAALARYAEKFQASPDWSFLTGGAADVVRVLKAFEVWGGSKFSHRPVTLLRRPGRPEWVRLEGLGNGAALAAEMRTLLE
jgi:protein SCO1/2